MSPTLTKVLQLVADLPAEEQQALLDYLVDTLPPTASPHQPIQLGGSLGAPLDFAESDPIADALEEVRRERTTHFEAEWPI